MSTSKSPEGLHEPFEDRIKFIEFLKKIFEEAEKSLTNEDIRLIDTAYSILKTHFGDKMRRDGVTRSMTHPIEVTKILASEFPRKRITIEKVLTCILHDIVEDTSLTLDGLKNMFAIKNFDNKALGNSVELVTKKGFGEYLIWLSENCYDAFMRFSEDNKIDKPKIADDQTIDEDTIDQWNRLYENRKQKGAEFARKMKDFFERAYYGILFGSDNDTAISVKIADRIHNLRTSEHMPIERQEAYIKETQHYIVPLLQKVNEENKGKYKTELELLNGAIKRALIKNNYRKTQESVKNILNPVPFNLLNNYAESILQDLSNIETHLNEFSIISIQDIRKHLKQINQNCNELGDRIIKFIHKGYGDNEIVKKASGDLLDAEKRLEELFNKFDPL